MKYNSIWYLPLIMILINSFGCSSLKKTELENTKFLNQNPSKKLYEISISLNKPYLLLDTLWIDNRVEVDTLIIELKEIDFRNNIFNDPVLKIEPKIAISKKSNPNEYVRPDIFLNDSLIFNTPGFTRDSSIAILCKTDFLEFTAIEFFELEYDSFVVKKSQQFSFKDYKIEIEDILRENNNDNYEPKDEDIFAGIKLSVLKEGEKIPKYSNPIYVIRGMEPYAIPDYLKEEKLIFLFVKINPSAEEFTVKVAQFQFLKKYPIKLILFR